MSKFYITTPIYYVNASPHIGHAYTSIIGDCLARFKRLKLGKDSVFYLTGTDEHGEKVKKAAQIEGEDTQVFVDRVVKNFEHLWEELNIEYDFFIRTTNPTHRKTVQEVIKKLNDKGDIYKASYRSFYCLPCESFWTDTQVKDTQGLCPTCKRKVEEIEEEDYFFKLSNYEQWLKDYLRDNPGFIQPKIRYNEVIGFLENNKLADLCISRPKKRISWGVDFPLDNNYVVYVWFDALLNYITAKEWYGIKPREFEKWWPADVHLIGKDILRHHAIFWPIMLHALGLKVPRMIFAHGWWKAGSDKMSKSLGNVVNPQDVIKKVGVDGLRYFLLREVPLGQDGSFSWPLLINRINSDLANDLGNLVYRVLNMAKMYFEGKVDPSGEFSFPEFVGGNKFVDNYVDSMDKLDFSDTLKNIWIFINAMNKYIEDKKPWVLWKEKKIDFLCSFLWSLLEGIRVVSVAIFPFMPKTSQDILKQLGRKALPKKLSINDMEICIKGFKIKKEAPLFPRIDVD